MCIRDSRIAVAAPGLQGSQVISRSLRSWGGSSGANASAVKEPGHFEVGKSSSQITRCKKMMTFFSRCPRLLVHTITEAKHWQGDTPGRSFDLALPGVAPPLLNRPISYSYISLHDVMFCLNLYFWFLSFSPTSFRHLFFIYSCFVAQLYVLLYFSLVGCWADSITGQKLSVSLCVSVC